VLIKVFIGIHVYIALVCGVVMVNPNKVIVGLSANEVNQFVKIVDDKCRADNDSNRKAAKRALRRTVGSSGVSLREEIYQKANKRFGVSNYHKNRQLKKKKEQYKDKKLYEFINKFIAENKTQAQKDRQVLLFTLRNVQTQMQFPILAENNRVVIIP